MHPFSASLPVPAPATPFGGSGFAPRQAEPHPHATDRPLPVRLTLHPLAASRTYAVVSFWEERIPGQAKRTTIEKSVHVVATARGGGLRMTCVTAPPVLRQPDLSPFEKTLLLVAGLYQRLELRLTPAGQPAELCNHAEILQTWDGVKQELMRRSGGDDEFTQVLVAGLDEQLQEPEALLESLRLDYLFGFLLQNVYEQRFEGGMRYGQARTFPQFFAGTDLWCRERLEMATAPGRVALRLVGVLDPVRTDLAAVAAHLATGQQLAAGPDAPALLLPAPTAVRFAYTGTMEVEAATGWPLSVEASVWCGVAGGYGKEYFLRLEASPEPSPLPAP